jgi:hypothetical protein
MQAQILLAVVKNLFDLFADGKFKVFADCRVPGVEYGVDVFSEQDAV